MNMPPNSGPLFNSFFHPFHLLTQPQRRLLPPGFDLPKGRGWGINPTLPSSGPSSVISRP